MKWLLINVIKFYQMLSNYKGYRVCRFYPSCSEYSILAINKYGILKGIFKSLIRLMKCHPLHKGGYDPA